MYEVKRAVSISMYDLYVNGIHVLRDSKWKVEEFVRLKVKPLGLISYE